MEKLPVILVLDNIRSLYNVGAIFRTADGVNLDKIILCGMTGTPEMKNPKLAKIHQGLGKISKTALGAENTVTWEYYKNIEDFLDKIKNKYQIVSLEQSKNSIQYNKYRYKFPLALIVGHEIKGVGDKVLKNSDAVVDIPMIGEKDSLNVSVATSIALYHLLSYYQITIKK
ncbi:MAG: tRNA/rRNA methyltransferase SpoU [Candidatus Berkelbacteria bacterium Licking1014_85]|uniref:tRNA/rRNA methyltransferase SpoU n=1 Tax=Candidatus Berkelbacteria bacterium Licking1014_85 TaxID=2017148 RepID=A0A554LH42_9BACT|nr:MAG: tRNA/rRNA methyltransferase SpoU [Candidatus Berkelbacteria bacterium Licking1014_85]